ncbi:MAG: 3-deoxy-manno-octulosonate cytidylyltransferase [Candidatus Omnitrophica bacterium]|nr:3-deoxy-manno-octulosonate cytidylyltransferase [Candidatus Omnitrophota bacterium]MBU1853810.1 3-deoxy-manno-octulosonate cytidylyltransferase [Candidatus Omnitrophota bacterium]
MEVIGIIPARYGSTRFEGKLLADLCGKSVIQHTWENAKKAKTIEDIIIATDDKRIYNFAKGFGAKVIYTSKAHKSGSDRLTEVVSSIDTKVVVNIQADEPLIHPTMIDDVVDPILRDDSIHMATLCHKIGNEKDFLDPNVVKVVMDRKGFALYFSRAPIPYLLSSFAKASGDRRAAGERGIVTHYKHIGIYAYTKDFLFTFKSLPQSRLEKSEKLEQLRVIENGYKIKVIETKFDTIGIDTPEDLMKATDLIKGARQLSLF